MGVIGASSGASSRSIEVHRGALGVLRPSRCWGSGDADAADLFESMTSTSEVMRRNGVVPSVRETTSTTPSRRKNSALDAAPHVKMGSPRAIESGLTRGNTAAWKSGASFPKSGRRPRVSRQTERTSSLCRLPHDERMPIGRVITEDANREDNYRGCQSGGPSQRMPIGRVITEDANWEGNCRGCQSGR